jgi:hypothetical protein
MDAAHRALDQLCCDYSKTPPAALAPRAQRALRRLESLLAGRLEPSFRRGLLVDAGWLHMLSTCIQNDLGNRDAAWASREAALALGRETGDLHLLAWAYETPSWFALYDGRPRDALDFALEGLRSAPAGSSGWMMLKLKAAAAWARLGNAAEAERHLEAVAQALDGLPPAGAAAAPLRLRPAEAALPRGHRLHVALHAGARRRARAERDPRPGGSRRPQP